MLFNFIIMFFNQFSVLLFYDEGDGVKNFGGVDVEMIKKIKDVKMEREIKIERQCNGK